MRTALEMAGFCLGLEDMSDPEVRERRVRQEIARRQWHREELIKQKKNPEKHKETSTQGLTDAAVLKSITGRIAVNSEGRFQLAELFRPIEQALGGDDDVLYAFTLTGIDTSDKSVHISESPAPKVAVAFTANRCVIGYRSKLGEERVKTIPYDEIVGVAPQRDKQVKILGSFTDCLMLGTTTGHIFFYLGIDGLQFFDVANPRFGRGRMFDLSTRTCVLTYDLYLACETVTDLVTKYKKKCGTQETAAQATPAEAPQATPAAAPKAGTGLSTETVETLKQLKELLDAGILTQEEFDGKKKQLLGL